MPFRSHRVTSAWIRPAAGALGKAGSRPDGELPAATEGDTPGTGQGDYILTPRELRPIAYEQGIDLETTV